nr:T9SS type A sorting domain-containing protein [Bacteroidota bacterium]
SGNYFEPAIAGEGDHLITYVYTNSSGCSDTAALSINVDKCLGVEVLYEKNIVISFNPSLQEIIIVPSFELTGNFKIYLFNMTGQTVYSSEKFSINTRVTINTSQLNPGIYILNFQGNDKVFSRKVFVGK